MKKVFALLFAVFIATSSFSQDKIYKKGGEIIEAKIIESGIEEIKYKLFVDPEGPTFTIEKERITKINYQSGRTEVYQSALKDPELYADQANMGIKINFLSPLSGYTQLNFEKSLRPGRGYELALGVIGLGKRQELDYYFGSGSGLKYRDARGAYFSGGFKFARIPDYAKKSTKYVHLMQGWYVKPEATFGIYQQNYNASAYSSSTAPVYKRETVVFGGLIINGGKQWVFGDLFLLDVYAGLGYAFDNQSGDLYNEYRGRHFGLFAAGDSGFGFASGFKVGMLLNKKKK